MATVPTPVFESRNAVQYTGTNSAEIAALINDFTVTGETATELQFTSGGTAYAVPRQGRIVYAQGAVEDTYANDDDFRDAWTEQALDNHVHDLVLTSGPAKMPEDPGQ